MKAWKGVEKDAKCCDDEDERPGPCDDVVGPEIREREPKAIAEDAEKECGQFSVLNGVYTSANVELEDENVVDAILPICFKTEGEQDGEDDRLTERTEQLKETRPFWQMGLMGWVERFLETRR